MQGAHSLHCVCKWQGPVSMLRPQPLQAGGRSAVGPAERAPACFGAHKLHIRFTRVLCSLKSEVQWNLLRAQSQASRSLPAAMGAVVTISELSCRLEAEVRRDLQNGRLPPVQPFHAMAYPFSAELALAISAKYAEFCAITASRMAAPKLQHPPAQPLQVCACCLTGNARLPCGLGLLGCCLAGTGTVLLTCRSWPADEPVVQGCHLPGRKSLPPGF